MGTELINAEDAGTPSTEIIIHNLLLFLLRLFYSTAV